MSEYTVKLLKSEYVTHDVKRFVFEKPAGYKFIPGQAADVSINTEEWKDEKRPFTFTSLNHWDELEFTIKIYRSHNGVTKQLEQLKKGSELLISDPWGAIAYKGDGVFIAAGAGITPFLAILRQLHHDHKANRCALIFSNKTKDDIILADELHTILGDRLHNVLTRQNVIGYLDRRIDEKMLIDLVKDFDQEFYLCGPDAFVDSMRKILSGLGVDAESVVVEA